MKICKINRKFNKIFIAILFLFICFNVYGNSQEMAASNLKDIFLEKENQKDNSIPVLERYSMTYLQLGGIYGIFPEAGIGYRVHKGLHGCDLSINIFTGIQDFFFENEYIPFIKAYYLNYPLHSKNTFSYWGLGAVVFPLENSYPYPILQTAWPIATIGYEWNKKGNAKFFMQIEGTFPVVIFSLGMGF